MKYFFTLFSVFVSLIANTQVVFDKKEHDFGRMYAGDERYVDIYLKNKTSKEAYVLSIRRPDEVVFIQKNALISPDSSTVIRFQINKKTKGNFSYTIPVYTSDKNEPTNIVLKGRIEELPPQDNNFAACPDFNRAPASGNPLDFILTVETIDKETKEKIGKSKVALLQNGRPIGNWNTSNKGVLQAKIPLGITYFYASHSDYHPAEEAMYVNFKKNYVVLELTRKKELIAETVKEPVIEREPVAEVVNEPIKKPKPTIEKEPIVETEKEPEPVIEQETVAETVKQPEPVREIEIEIPLQEEEKVIIFEKKPTKPIDISEDIAENTTDEEESSFIPPKLKDLDKDDFSEEYFRPINVIFVIDVSSSMNQFGRLDLLKYSLGELTDMLRPQDKVGMVAYASNAFVMLKSTTGDQKDKIMEEVDALKASGLTDGAAGIKLGYKQVWKNRTPDAQNHIIIVTDGSFNRSSGDYKKIIEKNMKKKNITMSVVGVKSNSAAEANMTEASDIGKGRFILIENLLDAQNKLQQEIRLSSFRY